MIPRSGPLFELNHTPRVEYPVPGPDFVPLDPHVTYCPPDPDGTMPTPALVVGGIPVHVYVDADGVFRVSVHTDAGDIDPHIWVGRGEQDAIAMKIDVNGQTVFHA